MIKSSPSLGFVCALAKLRMPMISTATAAASIIAFIFRTRFSVSSRIMYSNQNEDTKYRKQEKISLHECSKLTMAFICSSPHHPWLEDDNKHHPKNRAAFNLPNAGGDSLVEEFRKSQELNCKGEKINETFPPKSNGL